MIYLDEHVKIYIPLWGGFSVRQEPIQIRSLRSTDRIMILSNVTDYLDHDPGLILRAIYFGFL